MQRSFVVVIAATALAAAPWTAQAHHSAARFDLTIRDHYVTGIVKEFKAANPHTKIVLQITDEKGTRDVQFDWEPSTRLIDGLERTYAWIYDQMAPRFH